jgi:tetratricopeptide (TPR) repeat protein
MAPVGSSATLAADDDPGESGLDALAEESRVESISDRLTPAQTQPVDAGEWLRCYETGKEFESQGKYWEAVAQYKRAEMLNGDSADVLNHLGFCNCMLGRVNEAQEIFLRALEKNPSHVEVLVRLAGTFESQEDYYNATMVYRRAVGVLTGLTFK